MAHRLFIVITNRLRERKYLSLSDEDTDVVVISLQDGLLLLENEPGEGNEAEDFWTTVVKKSIAKRIRSHNKWEDSTIRIAGHVRTCFGSLPQVDWRNDRRLPDKEGELLEELGVEIDVQIWGFHHEPKLSEIWTVVRQVKDVWKHASPEPKAQFLIDLEAAFQRAHAQFEQASTLVNTREKWERFALMKHDIVGLFDPLRLRLETAKEIMQDNPTRSRQILASVEESIELKLAAALALLNKCNATAIGVNAEESLPRTVQHLKTRPALDDFPQWLDGLNDLLTELRDSIKK